MLDIFTVSLFGHREVDNLLRIEEQLEKLITELLSTKEYVEFSIPFGFLSSFLKIRKNKMNTIRGRI